MPKNVFAIFIHIVCKENLFLLKKIEFDGLLWKCQFNFPSRRKEKEEQKKKYLDITDICLCNWGKQSKYE